MLVLPPKDPNEVLDYAIDWESRISPDTISSSTFSLTTAAGMTIDDSTDDGEFISIVTLSGGTVDNRGKLLCEIVTAEGQTLQQTATILVRAR